jgi:hypothetical protein
MARPIHEIIADFASFQSSDFDLGKVDSQGADRLSDLVGELFETPNPEQAMDAMFRMMESLPESDLGTPGPLVHGLEKFKDYETQLAESVRRTPAPLSVWMINRILNTALPRERRKFWLSLLEESLARPEISERLREDIQGFLDHQKQRTSR